MRTWSSCENFFSSSGGASPSYMQQVSAIFRGIGDEGFRHCSIFFVSTRRIEYDIYTYKTHFSRDLVRLHVSCRPPILEIALERTKMRKNA